MPHATSSEITATTLNERFPCCGDGTATAGGSVGASGRGMSVSTRTDAGSTGTNMSPAAAPGVAWAW